MYIYNEVSGNTIQGSLEFEYRYLLVKKTCQCQLDLLKRVIHVIERTTDVYEITLIGKLVSKDK